MSSPPSSVFDLAQLSCSRKHLADGLPFVAICTKTTSLNSAEDLKPRAVKYLSHQEGDTFQVIEVHQHRWWLARNLKDVDGIYGWVWSRNFLRIPRRVRS
ncbi:hypothetical protein FPQ18DRAFT_401126 [Pyronema domesticum]|nr:hypothetical protein FPQ18DRAFT_401126 [Pyronema domesticum]